MTHWAARAFLELPMFQAPLHNTYWMVILVFLRPGCNETRDPRYGPQVRTCCGSTRGPRKRSGRATHHHGRHNSLRVPCSSGSPTDQGATETENPATVHWHALAAVRRADPGSGDAAPPAATVDKEYVFPGVCHLSLSRLDIVRPTYLAAAVSASGETWWRAHKSAMVSP